MKTNEHQRQSKNNAYTNSDPHNNDTHNNDSHNNNSHNNDFPRISQPGYLGIDTWIA